MFINQVSTQKWWKSRMCIQCAFATRMQLFSSKIKSAHSTVIIGPNILWSRLVLLVSCRTVEMLTKVLFTDRYKWQNFRLRLLRLVNRLYAVIYKTQKSKTKVLPWGAFNDYVDTILPFFDHHPPPTSTRTFLTLNVAKNRDFLDHLPPLLVHVVIECPHVWQSVNSTLFTVCSLLFSYIQTWIEHEFKCLYFSKKEKTLQCLIPLHKESFV